MRLAPRAGGRVTLKGERATISLPLTAQLAFYSEHSRKFMENSGVSRKRGSVPRMAGVGRMWQVWGVYFEGYLPPIKFCLRPNTSLMWNIIPLSWV